ncbi:MAG: response regulator transcription factor [Clostridia bacterium]|nr:response regulator transcription factor [Clostridia bacterium]
MAENKKILLADDDADIREVGRVLLEGEGYQVVEAKDGDEAVSLAAPDIDLYILDIMMPGKSGYQACREIRAASAAPILFLTARSQDSDKAMGFSSGADDYLAKPFSYTELLARVKALLRRYYVYKGKEESAGSVIAIRELTIDPDSMAVTLAGRPIQLTDIEFRLLSTMAQNRKKVFSAQELYEQIWNEPYFYACNNTVMVHIRNLRRKIEPDPDNPQYVKTVWGKGYRVD